MSGMSALLPQAQIIILEILECIPVVIIFALLDLEKTISFSDSLLEPRTDHFRIQIKQKASEKSE